MVPKDALFEAITSSRYTGRTWDEITNDVMTHLERQGYTVAPKPPDPDPNDFLRDVAVILLSQAGGKIYATDQFVDEIALRRYTISSWHEGFGHWFKLDEE